MFQGNSTRNHAPGAGQKERKNMRYEVVIVWDHGQTDVKECETLEEAESIKAGYEMAFGSQVWCCIR